MRTQQNIVTSHKRSLKDKARQLSNAAIATKSDTVREMHEKQMEELAAEIEKADQSDFEKIDFNVHYRTALDKTKKLLKSPYYAWVNLNVHEKQKLFYFIFETKLPYNHKTWYRTDKVASAVRLFEEFTMQKTSRC